MEANMRIKFPHLHRTEKSKPASAAEPGRVHADQNEAAPLKQKRSLRGWWNDHKPARRPVEMSFLPGMSRRFGTPKQKVNEDKTTPTPISKEQRESDETRRAAESLQQNPILTSEQPSIAITDSPGHQSKHKVVQMAKDCFRPQSVLPERRHLQEPAPARFDQSVADEITAVREWYQDKLKNAKDSGDEASVKRLETIIERRHQEALTCAVDVLPEQEAVQRSALSERLLTNDVQQLADSPNFLPLTISPEVVDKAKRQTLEHKENYQKILEAKVIQKRVDLANLILNAPQCWGEQTVHQYKGPRFEGECAYLYNGKPSIHAYSPLQKELRAVADRILPNTAPSALNKVDVMDIFIEGLSAVTHTPEEGLAVLKQLQAHSPLDASSAEDRDDLKALHQLFHLMNESPRGLEVLEIVRGISPQSLAKQAETHAEPRADIVNRHLTLTRLQAAGAFWSAHAQCAKEHTTQADRDWLGGSMKIARKMMQMDLHTATDLHQDWQQNHLPDSIDSLYGTWHAQNHQDFKPRELAAYGAVCSGHVSQEPGSPYGVHRQRLSTSMKEWIDHSNLAFDPVSRTAARVLWPGHKTPFANVRLAENVATHIHHTNRRVADGHTQQAGRALARFASDRSLSDSVFADEAQRVVVQALAERIDHKPEFLLSESKLKLKDRRAIHHAVVRQTSEKPVLSGSDFNYLQRLSLHSIHPKPVMQAVQQVCEFVQKSLDAGDLSSEQYIDFSHRLNTVFEPTKAAKAADDVSLRKKVTSARDVYELFKPMFEQWGAHDFIQLTEQASIGAQLTSAPVNFILNMAGISPFLGAYYEHSSLAGINAHAYTHIMGLEVQSGSSHKGKIDAGCFFGFKLPGDMVYAGAQINAGVTPVEFAHQQSTALRFVTLNKAEQDNQKAMLNLWQSYALHAEFENEDCQPIYVDPLEAALALNPDLRLMEVDTQTFKWGTDVGAQGGFGVVPKGLNLIVGRGMVGVDAEFHKTKNTIKESENAEMMHNLQHNAVDITAHLSAVAVAALGSSKTGKIGNTGTVGIPRAPLSASLSVQLARRGEDIMLLDSILNRGAVLVCERSFKKVDSLLAEIRDKRDTWLARLIRELPADEHGETHTPENQKIAQAVLEQLELELVAMPEKTKFLSYYISYISKPEVNAKIDAYKTKIAIFEKKCDQRYDLLLKDLEVIAANFGITFEELMREVKSPAFNSSGIAQEASSKINSAVDEINIERDKISVCIQKINDIKCNPDNYTPEEMFVREKGSDTKTWGFNIILRRMRKMAVDVQSGAAVYPPRHLKAAEVKAQYSGQVLPEGQAPDVAHVAAEALVPLPADDHSDEVSRQHRVDRVAASHIAHGAVELASQLLDVG
jgi:hypothetical protein